MYEQCVIMKGVYDVLDVLSVLIYGLICFQCFLICFLICIICFLVFLGQEYTYAPTTVVEGEVFPLRFL